MSNKQSEQDSQNRQKSGVKKSGEKRRKGAAEAPDAGRRRLIWIGAGAVALAGAGVAGWYARHEKESAIPQSKPAATGGKNLNPLLLTADAENATKVCDEMLRHYTLDLNNPSAIIHAVRGFGKGFQLADGSNAVEHLCTRYAADREVDGRRYVYFKREAEVHENSFLKTFLEAGVPLDQPVQVGDRRYTLRDVVAGAQALFRCDPTDLFKYDADQYRYDQSYQVKRQVAPGQLADQRGELVHEHLPWGIIAFSILHPAGPSSTWTNAWKEPIDLAAIIDQSLADYESTCALGEQQITRSEEAPLGFRSEIKKYSCFGLHSVYGYLVGLKSGYRNNDLPQRVKQMMDLLTYRLTSDAVAIQREYAREAAGAAPYLVDAFTTRALVKLYGHAFEAINYARLNELVTFTPAQERRIAFGAQAMYESLIKLRGMDWGLLRRNLGDKFISDIVIALGHNSRALKL
ncbi:MAG: hypothetical protein ACKOB4_16305, partial [Acidobacteriota bacterium]